MSLSAQFRQSQQDAHDAQRSADLENISRACEYIADHFPGAAKKIAARALAGKEKNWFQKRKTEKWILSLKGVKQKELAAAAEFFEAIPGFRKLRDACAAPDMDIELWVYISPGEKPSINVSVDPTQSFSKSVFSIDEVRIPITTPAPTPASAAPAVESVSSQKIVVMSPLRLK